MPREKKNTLDINTFKKKRHQPYFIIGHWTYKEQSNLAMIKNIKCNKKKYNKRNKNTQPPMFTSGHS